MISQIREAAFSCVVFAFVLCFGSLQSADEPVKEKEDEARREEQLKILKRLAAQHTVYPAGERKRPFSFHEQCLIRFTNPLTGCKDGGYYIWLDSGRPQAIVKVYTYDYELYSQEWQSLAENAIVAERDGKSVWYPNESGVTFRELAGAPIPAESAVNRLFQMKSMAEKFSATYTDNKNPLDLRLLAKPMFRYEPADKQRDPDGAVFAFANGTNPMAILLLEARQVGESRKWHYAFARTGTGAVAAKYGEKEVFSADKYDHRRDPTQTFLQLWKLPVSKE